MTFQPAGQNPVVSIVIVNYETSAYVQRCIESLAAASAPPHEIIVVDNPSPAGDLSNLPSDLPNVRIVASPENIGFGLGCNLGADHAHPASQYIAILNPDTAVPPGQLQRWLDAHHSACPSGGIHGPALHNENGSVQRSSYRFPNGLTYWATHSLLAGFLINLKKGSWTGGKGSGFRQAASLEEIDFQETTFAPQHTDWLMGAALLVDRPTWLALGGFSDKYFLYSEDTDLCWRARQLGRPTIYDPTVHIWHTQGDPAGSARETGIVRLFDGLKRFTDNNYTGLKKWGMYFSVKLDMRTRCLIFLVLQALRPPSDLRTSRLNGYRRVLQQWKSTRP